MAMQKCKECGSEVSSKAKKCPHCGVDNPTVSAKDALIGGLGMIVLLAGLGYFFLGGDEESADPESSVAEEEGSTGEETEDKLSDEECKKDLQCWGDRHSAYASAACSPEIEKLAKYDYEWTDGWTGVRLARFSFSDKEAGTLNYYGDAIKFSNGYGAFQHHIYRCEYDPEKDEVLSVEAEPGQL